MASNGEDHEASTRGTRRAEKENNSKLLETAFLDVEINSLVESIKNYTSAIRDKVRTQKKISESFIIESF